MLRMHAQVLGRALKGLPRDKVIVATKVGRYGADSFDFSAERVTRSVHESLARLQASIVYNAAQVLAACMTWLNIRMCVLRWHTSTSYRHMTSSSQI